MVTLSVAYLFAKWASIHSLVQRQQSWLLYRCPGDYPALDPAVLPKDHQSQLPSITSHQKPASPWPNSIQPKQSLVCFKQGTNGLSWAIKTTGLMILQQREPTASCITTAGSQKEVLCLLITYLAKTSVWTRPFYITKTYLIYDPDLDQSFP